jgi:hypothetical protein
MQNDQKIQQMVLQNTQLITSQVMQMKQFMTLAKQRMDHMMTTGLPFHKKKSVLETKLCTDERLYLAWLQLFWETGCETMEPSEMCTFVMGHHLPDKNKEKEKELICIFEPQAIYYLMSRREELGLHERFHRWTPRQLWTQRLKPMIEFYLKPLVFSNNHLYKWLNKYSIFDYHISEKEIGPYFVIKASSLANEFQRLKNAYQNEWMPLKKNQWALCLKSNYLNKLHWRSHIPNDNDDDDDEKKYSFHYYGMKWHQDYFVSKRFLAALTLFWPDLLYPSDQKMYHIHHQQWVKDVPIQELDVEYEVFQQKQKEKNINQKSRKRKQPEKLEKVPSIFSSLFPTWTLSKKIKIHK